VLTCHNLDKFDFFLIFIDIFYFGFIEREPGKMKKNIRLGLGGLPYCRLTNGVADTRIILSITGSSCECS